MKWTRVHFTSKGKLERWHRTLREQFLAELDATHIRDLADLNARLWALSTSTPFERGSDMSR